MSRYIRRGVSRPSRYVRRLAAASRGPPVETTSHGSPWSAQAMKRALLVGIDEYDRFGGLDGCVNDVNALEPLLSRNEDNSPNFDCQKRTSATGGVTRDALLGDIDAARRWGGRGAALLRRPRRRLGDRRGARDRDATPATPGIAFSEILAKVAESSVREVILILDCCFSGAAGGIPNWRVPPRPYETGCRYWLPAAATRWRRREPRPLLQLPRRRARGGCGRRPREGDDRGAVLLPG